MPCNDSALSPNCKPNSNGPSRRKYFGGSKREQQPTEAKPPKLRTRRYWPRVLVNCPFCLASETCCRCKGQRRMDLEDAQLGNAWDRPGCTECQACDRLRIARIGLEQPEEPAEPENPKAAAKAEEARRERVEKYRPGTFRDAFEERARREAARWIKR